MRVFCHIWNGRRCLIQLSDVYNSWKTDPGEISLIKTGRHQGEGAEGRSGEKACYT